MNILPALRTLEKTELAAASLYTWFHELFTGDDEAAFLFYRLSVEEKGHANLVRFIIRLAGKESLDSFALELDVVAMAKAIEEIRHIQTLSNISLRQAVQFALDLENQVFEFHSRKAVTAALPGIGGLIQSLGRLDQAHVMQLTDFAKERGFLFDAPTS